MRLDISECKTCDNINKCNRYCMKKVGRSLAKYVSGVETVQTNIGDFKEDTAKHSMSYIVGGKQIINNISAVDLLCSTSKISLDKDRKFVAVRGKQPLSVLRDYMSDISNEALKTKIETKLINIINSKELVLPVNTGNKILYELKNDGDKKVSRIEAQVESIIWTNTPKGKLESYVLFGFDDKTCKKYKVSLESYGEQLKLASIDGGIRSSSINTGVIKMTNFGMIKPIVFCGYEKFVAVDNYGVYYGDKFSGETYLIYTWNNGELIVTDKEKCKLAESTKMYDEFKRNIIYIKQHLKYIVPLGIIAHNEISIKE